MTKIISDPEVNNGAPTIAGLGINPEKVVSEIFNGSSKDEVAKRFPGLTEDDILGCLEWYRLGRPKDFAVGEEIAA